MLEPHSIDHARSLSPGLMRICAAVAVLGAVMLVATNIIGSIVVPGHDWIADTVSDLGAGKYQRIQDYGLFFYAAGLLALALGCAHFHAGRWDWTLGCFVLAVLALLVTVIGARNEYGDGDHEGVVIHIYLVYGLGVFYAVGPILMLRGLWKRSRGDVWASVVAAVLWSIGAPLFFMTPTGYDGLVERILGLFTLIWIVTLARHLWTAARDLSR